VAFERTISEIALLRKEVTEARELLRVRKEHKRGRRLATKRRCCAHERPTSELRRREDVRPPAVARSLILPTTVSTSRDVLS
jgi:hypothetical protein